MARSRSRDTAPKAVGGVTNRAISVPNGVNDLSDVTITAPTDGQTLQYVAANNRWENKDGAIRYVALTEAEYNALPTKDPNTLYLVRA